MKCKKWMWILAVLPLLFVFTTCGSNDEQGSSNVISGIDMTALLPLPVEGQEIPLSIPDQPNFTGVIDWDIMEGGFWDSLVVQEGDTFIAHRAYRAFIRLTAIDGYTFQGAAANSFVYSQALSTNPAGIGDTLTVTVRFFYTPAINDTLVYLNDLAVALPAPVRGAAPVSAFSVSQYAGSVVWQTAAGVALTENYFQANAVYRAVVTLTPVFGYTFSGLQNGTGITHSAALSSSFNLINGTVTLEFNPTTAAGQDNVVNLYNLTGVLTRPMYNRTPSVNTIVTPQYTGTVSWFYMDDSAIIGRLERNMPFRAVVSLTAQTGFTFDGVPENVFFHDQMLWAENAIGTGNSLTVTVAFPGASGEIRWLNAADFITITGCCWTNLESPRNLIDGSNSTRWAYAWGNNDANIQMNHTDWPQMTGEDPRVTAEQGTLGHPVVLDPLAPAHFFTFDLRRARNIAAIRARPSGIGNNPQRFFGDWEVFVSDSFIGIDPLADGAISIQTGSFNFDGVRWYEADLFHGDDDNDYAIARFLQFRVFSSADGHAQNIWVEAGRLEVGVYE